MIAHTARPILLFYWSRTRKAMPIILLLAATSIVSQLLSNQVFFRDLQKLFESGIGFGSALMVSFWFFLQIKTNANKSFLVSSLPNYILASPVSSTTIALVTLLCGFTLTGALVFIFKFSSFNGFQIFCLCLTVMGTFAWAQAVLWKPMHSEWSKVFFSVGFFVGFGYFVVLSRKNNIAFANANFYQLLVFFSLGVAAAIWATHQTRRNPIPRRWFRFSLPKPSTLSQFKSFRTSNGAQVREEARIAWKSPTLQIFLMSLLPAVIAIVPKGAEGLGMSAHLGLINFAFGSVILITMANGSVRGFIHPYLATLPISEVDIIYNKMKASAIVYGILFLYFALVWVAVFRSSISQMLTPLQNEYGSLVAILLLIALFCTLVAYALVFHFASLWTGLITSKPLKNPYVQILVTFAIILVIGVVIQNNPVYLWREYRSLVIVFFYGLAAVKIFFILKSVCWMGNNIIQHQQYLRPTFIFLGILMVSTLMLCKLIFAETAPAYVILIPMVFVLTPFLGVLWAPMCLHRLRHQ